MNEVGKKSKFQEVLCCFEPIFNIFLLNQKKKTCGIVWGMIPNMKKTHSSERILRLMTYTMCWRNKFKVGGPINTFGETQII